MIYPRAWNNERILFWVALGLITAAGCWLRWTWIGHFMRYDESYSAMVLVRAGDLFNYTEPNNHVLNTLLMQLCARLGGFSITMLRMPAFLSGVLMIPAAACAGFAMSGKRMAALLAAIFVAGSSILVEYSVNARGYSMVCLASLVLLALSVRLVEKPERWWLWVAWAVAAILGLYAVPTMLESVLLMAGLMLAAGGRGQVVKLGWRLVLVLCVVGLVTAILYVPVIRENGLKALVGNRWVTPQPLGTLPGALSGSFAELADDWGRDVSWVAFVLLVTGAMGSVAGAVMRRNVFWSLPVVSIGFIVLFMILQRRVPPARAVLYVLPLILTSAGVGLAYCCGLVRQAGARCVAPGCVLFAALLGWGANAWAIEHRPYMISEYAGTCVDIEALTRFMVDRGLYSGTIFVLPSLETSAPFAFYTYLFAPAQGRAQPNPGDPACREFYILARRPEDARGVYLKTPHLSAFYKEPVLAVRFPTACVFVCQRR